MKESRVALILRLALLLFPGVGIALAFTLFRKSDDWVGIGIAIMVYTASFVLGWSSPKLANALLLPMIMFASLSVAFSVFGIDSSDILPVLFAFTLSVMYGGLASVTFAVGWVVHREICRVRR